MEIRSDEQVVRLGGIMKQTLLAALLVRGGSVVTVDSLIEELWGAAPPARVENALQAQVSRLRRRIALLERGREPSRLATTDSGYLLTVEPGELDAGRFQRTVDRVAARAENGDTPDVDIAVEEIRQALRLWRGPVFGGLAGGPLCRAAAIRLHECRHAALRLLYELELKRGRHASILPELTELCAQNPLNEEFCALLMIALYRSGRQIESLNLYRRFRHRLATDLGVDPSPVLRQCEVAILNHDPHRLANRIGCMTYELVG
jgi:DNA-binding SARP family transcriptional activator